MAPMLRAGHLCAPVDVPLLGHQYWPFWIPGRVEPQKLARDFYPN